MRTPSRRLQLTRWLATTISVAILATWITAAFSGYDLSNLSLAKPKRVLAFGYGCFLWFEPAAQNPYVDLHNTYYTVAPPKDPTFRPGLVLPTSRVVPSLGRYVIIPLWLPFLLAAVPTALLWRRDRRPGPDDCQNCGYNMTANVSGKCPECGTPVQSTATPNPPPPPQLFV